MANASRFIKPKWELYDLNENPEHDLWEDYIVEFVDIAGTKIEYYISNYDTMDKDELYGEPLYQNLTYSDPIESKMIYEVTEEPALITSFGINSEDMIAFAYMPVKTWIRDISRTDEPKPGDVIRTLWNSRAYEVVTIKKELTIFELYKRAYNFILKPYRFSEESEEARDISINPDLTLSDSPSGVESFGDNDYIEDASDDIDPYGDVDTSVYGY